VIDTWRERWEMLVGLQERVEQHYTGKRCGQNDGPTDFAGFVVQSENLRDGVQIAINEPKNGKVMVAMKRSTSLAIAHDLAIKIKHLEQSEPPWTGATDVEAFDTPRGVYNAPPRRLGQAQVISWPPAPKDTPEPNTWAHQWEIRYTPASARIAVDGLEFSRSVIGDWREILDDLGLH
jgi:hypothetical protein